ncbi:RrF2 family transcriptional regulator [Gracilimonas sp. Q87]|uniref:RrF2 family transcriptional regulator n=1 Tax=Gracilimonas sp. Q87 TaxID=3384766 RepID=UPI0039841473
MFSTSCHYGLQSMLYIAMYSSPDKNVGLTEIADKQEIPKHFLSKILQELVKHGLLESTKGPNGGFRLSRKQEDIALIEVIEAIDGLGVFTKCGIGFKKCSDDHPCPIHHEYKKVREKIHELFRDKTLKELTEDVELGESIINMQKIPE